MSRPLRAAAFAALVATGAGCGDGTPPADGGAEAGPGDGAREGKSDAVDARDAADAPVDRAVDVAVAGPPNACAPGAAWFDLPYTVASAAWSRARGLIVVRPETEHAIYVIDPATCDTTRVAVPRLPLSIAVSPTDTDVAVGQDGVVSLVDVATRTVRTTIPIPAPATELAFDAAGHVLVFSRTLATVATQLLVVDPAAAGLAPGLAVAPAGTLDGGGHLRATPDGRGFFWTNDAQTTADSAARIVLGRSPLLGNPVAAGPGACHDLFPSDDSGALITACGTVLGLSATDATLDLAPAGVLLGVTSVQHADTNVAKGFVAVVPAADGTVSPPPDGSLRVYATKDLSLVGSVPLPVLDTGQEHQTPHGRYVFLSQDGTRAYVLARRQPGQAPVDGVAVLDPASATSSDLAPTVAVSGSFPHRSGLPLPLSLPRLAATVTFRVTDAGYSRALDRLVMSSTKPGDAVVLVDPATGAATALPAPANPSTITIRGDGLVAAVTRDGGIRFYDLRTRAVLRDVDGPATSVTFGAGSEVLLATDASTSAWLDLATGATRAASVTAAETAGFSAVPGTSRFYSLRGRGLVRHDDAIAAADPSFDLAPFVPSLAIVKPCATPFWITDEGSHLVLDCSRVFGLSPERALDLRYLGTLETVSTLEHVAYSPTTHRFYSAPDLFVFSDGLATAIGRIAVHDDQSLDLVSSIDLGTFPGTSALSHAMRVFLGQTPQQLIVVAQSDFFEPPTHAVYTFDVTGL